MIYPELNLIKTGDVLDCEGNGIIAKGISLFTGSKVTHTALAIRIKEFNNRLFIIDAQSKGIFPLPYEVWIKKYDYNFTVRRLPDENLNLIANVKLRAVSQIGAKYDYGLLLGEQPVEIIKDKLGIDSDVSIKFKGNGKFVCSEFVQWCYMIEQAYKYTPKMVKEYHDENHWSTITKRYL